MTSAQFQSLLRTVLKFGSGVLVTHGVITDSVAEPLIGAVATVAPVIWDMFIHSDTGAISAADTVKTKELIR